MSYRATHITEGTGGSGTRKCLSKDENYLEAEVEVVIDTGCTRNSCGCNSRICKVFENARRKETRKFDTANGATNSRGVISVDVDSVEHQWSILPTLIPNLLGNVNFRSGGRNWIDFDAGVFMMQSLLYSFEWSEEGLMKTTMLMKALNEKTKAQQLKTVTSKAMLNAEDVGDDEVDESDNEDIVVDGDTQPRLRWEQDDTLKSRLTRISRWIVATRKFYRQKLSADELSEVERAHESCHAVGMAKAFEGVMRGYYLYLTKVCMVCSLIASTRRVLPRAGLTQYASKRGELWGVDKLGTELGTVFQLRDLFSRWVGLYAVRSNPTSTTPLEELQRVFSKFACQLRKWPERVPDTRT